MNPPNNVISAFVEAQTVRTSDNLRRARKLVDLYGVQYGQKKGKGFTHETDLLRAAVVFTHACLEDFLRSLSATFLPWADEAALIGVPLVGTAGRAEKFFLGRLAEHRGKTVQALIQESVDAHLEESNYNDTREIARVLTAFDMKHPEVEAVFSDLDAMIRRRHQIVHRADRVSHPGGTRQRAKPLKPATVSAWIDATACFIVAILTRVPAKATRFRRKKTGKALV